VGTTNVDVSSKVGAHVTLTAGEVETVNFTRPESAAPFYTPNPISVVEIINAGDDDLWYTVDGTDPAVAGQHCYRLPGGMSDTRDMPSRQTNTIRLIADAVVPASVQRVS